MDFVQALVLGIVQGIIEWLPVSSEAVLTLVMVHAFGGAVVESVNTAIWLHTGTMLAALLYFRDRFRSLLQELYAYLRARGRLLAGTQKDEDQRRVLGFLVVGTLVTAVVGGVLYVVGIETVADYPDVFTGVMGAALFLTGLLRLYGTGETRDTGTVTYQDGVVVGVLQGLAVVPGVSRSGSTVFGLLYRDFSAEDAFVLSFLLSVPAVFIANIGINLLAGFAVTTELVVAAATAFIVGYGAIDAVLKIAGSTRIAYLCFALAGISWLPLLL